ncbi:type III-A CRISPR-associated protein Cas10/Csm1 [Crassaminicella thermophila]|uniref:type III-A CRISPR-associated protein Cas10/Csm1 n=1 Tax=Crassaminicella thermophila TaxID=2599308 RepID=UPI00143DA635|nr:type III-A CRISPR-associated protein Cas10/Csm1 [Crassaminicella thermophila]
MNINEKLCVAIGGLFHDIGKVLRRSRLKSKGKSHSIQSEKYVKDYFSNIDFLKDEELELIEYIARYHHVSDENISKALKENSMMEEVLKYIKYVKKADGESAGERKIEGKNKRSIEDNPFTNMLSLMWQAFNDRKYNSNFNYFRPNIFSRLNMPKKYIEKEEISSYVNIMKNELGRDLDNLRQYNERFKEHEDEFVACLQYLMKEYTSYITSCGKEIVRDISMYNHSVTTAALALCRCIDEKDKQRINEYILLHGRIYDIQKYIYGDINKRIEKPLRRVLTRSNIISILNTIIPYEIIQELKLYTTNILFCGGGTFSLLLPKKYEDEAEKIIERIKKKVAEIFENKIYIEYVLKTINVRDKKKEYSYKTHKKYMKEFYEYKKDFQKANNELNQKKYNRSIYLIDFNKNCKEEYYKCSNCGINTKRRDKCSICQIEENWMDKDIYDVKIAYEKMRVENIEAYEKLEATKKGQTVILFDEKNIEKYKDKYPIGGIYPVGKYSIPKSNELCKKCSIKDICDEKSDGKILSLTCIEKLSKNERLVATAKIDLDDMAFLMYYIYPVSKKDKKSKNVEKYPFAISRLANLADLINVFFTQHLVSVVKNKYTEDIFILYSGGDDILLTGNWERVYDFVLEINKTFNRYIGQKSEKRNITLTSSIVLHKATRPFNMVLKEVNRNMSLAKETKNLVIINEVIQEQESRFRGICINYKNLKKAKKIISKYTEWIEEEKISRGLLYDLVTIMNMRKKGGIEALKGASILNYILEKNEVDIDISNEIKALIKEKEIDLSIFILKTAIRKSKKEEL